MSFFAKLKQGLKGTSTKLSEGLKAVFVYKKLNQETLDELYDLLLMSDLGIPVSNRIIQAIKSQKFDKDISPDDVKKIIVEEIEAILTPHVATIKLKKDKPTVILVVGVNGTGKTTTIAKLAHSWKQQKYDVRLAAADTFRAAAVDQLEVWASRLKIPLYKSNEGADPASVAFQAYHQSQGADVLLIDTAGRLHNKKYLIYELEKISRVLKKIDPKLPHEVIIVLDATTGQNALRQVNVFSKTIPLTGLILTKLDGTAKGGILVALAEQYKLPVYAIGVGEGFNDMQAFDAREFAKSLIGLAS